MYFMIILLCSVVLTHTERKNVTRSRLTALSCFRPLDITRVQQYYIVKFVNKNEKSLYMFASKVSRKLGIITFITTKSGTETR